MQPRLRGRPACVAGDALAHAVGLFFLAPLTSEHLLGNLKSTELHLHVSLPDACGVTCPGARIAANPCLHSSVLRVGAWTAQPFPARSHVEGETPWHSGTGTRLPHCSRLSHWRSLRSPAAGTAGTTAAAGATTTNTVTASGAGTAQAAPDTAEMSFGVTTMSANAKSALDEASKVAEQIASAVKKQGVADEDIQTQDVSVYPQTVDQDGKQVITGYQASLSVRVKVRDIAKLGEVISAANAAGANNISGPAFTVDDPAPARAEAIDEAVADARKSAEAMAEAAGKSVGEVLSMSSSDVGMVPGAMYSQADMAGAAKDVPIEPGQLDITASVIVVFELK